MTLISILGRRIGRGLRAGLGLVALAGLGALAACGGGTTQVEDFVPVRVFAFGDETSMLLADGRKYSVNALDGDGALACQTEPVWTQAVARNYGFVFAECNPNAVADPRAVMAAAPGARADDLAGQIDAQIAAGLLEAGSLATVMMGANDVWALYAQFPARTEGELKAEARALGARVAGQVNRLVDRDVRVIVATVIDLGKTPFALAERAAHDDVDRAALISRLGAELNAGMRVNIVNDGRFVGLVLADEMLQAIVKAPSAFGVVNVQDRACTIDTPDCTSATLATSETRSSTWLWADDFYMAYGGQVRLGLLAVARANNNPF